MSSGRPCRRPAVCGGQGWAAGNVGAHRGGTRPDNGICNHGNNN